MSVDDWTGEAEVRRQLDGIAHGIEMLRIELRSFDRASASEGQTRKLLLEWIRDDVRSLLARRDRPQGSRGGAIALAASAGISGFLLCAALVMGFGLVDGNKLWGIQQPEPALVSGVARRAEPQATRLPRGGREEIPLVDLVEPRPVVEPPPMLAPPGVEKAVNAARGRGGPEEYLGRREDKIGLHPDVLPDATP